jgi:hypothetical protein
VPPFRRLVAPIHWLFEIQDQIIRRTKRETSARRVLANEIAIARGSQVRTGLAAGGASQQRTRLWNQAIGRILFELFFTLTRARTRARAETKTRRVWRSAAAVSEMEFRNLQVM